MATTSRIKTWSSGDVLTAADLNAEFNNLLTGGVNNISNANVASNAAIAYSKLSLSSSVLETDLGFTDITTGDVTTSKHGLTPKAPNDTSKFLRGDATWTAPTSTQLNDTNALPVIKTTATASAVDQFTATNAATGGTPTVQMAATGTDSNIHAQFNAKGNGLVKISVLRQDITANTYKHNSVILTGWGYKTSAVSQTDSQAVTFGITFAAVPIVICSSAGGKSGGAPSVFGDLVTSDYGVNVFGLSYSTTGFSAAAGSLSIDGNNPGNLNTAIANWGYSWIAVGEMS